MALDSIPATHELQIVRIMGSKINRFYRKQDNGISRKRPYFGSAKDTRYTSNGFPHARPSQARVCGFIVMDIVKIFAISIDQYIVNNNCKSIIEVLPIMSNVTRWLFWVASQLTSNFSKLSCHHSWVPMVLIMKMYRLGQKFLDFFFQSPKSMCNLIWNYLIIHYDIQQSPKCFYVEYDWYTP